MTTLTATEQVNNAITEAGGNARDALNATLAQRDTATTLLKTEQGRSVMLLVALEAIRTIVWMFGAPSQSMEDIDQVACEALRLSGQIPRHTTEED